MSHRPAPPRPVQPSQRQTARFAAPAPAPATRSTPRAPRNNDSNLRTAHPNNDGKQASQKSSPAKGDLASRITYSNASGSRINNTPAAGNNPNNHSLSRPSDNTRSAAAARLANIAHHTVPPPRAQQSRSANGQAHIPPNGPSGSRRSSSDYNNVPNVSSGRASRRQPPAQAAFDLVDPAQWLAITNAKIRPQQVTTASSLRTETKPPAEHPALPTKKSSSQPPSTTTKQLLETGPVPPQDSAPGAAALPRSSAIATDANTKQNSNLAAALPTQQTSSQTANPVTKQLPKTGPAPTQSSGTSPSTTAIPASSVTTSNAITKQNGNFAANTDAVDATKPMTIDGASDKDIKKPTRTYDMATLKSLGRPSEAISRSSRPTPPPVVASEVSRQLNLSCPKLTSLQDLISISAKAPSQSKEAAAAKKDPASNGLLGLIMSNERGSGGLAASKWAK